MLAALVLAGCRSADERPVAVGAPLPPLAARYVQQAQQALAQQAYLQGLALADSAVAHAPFAPQGHFVRGRLYVELGRLDEAAAAYRTVMQLQDDYPGLAHNMGNVAFRQRRYRDALTWYAREAERSNDPNPWHGLGGTHEALGDAAAAYDAYTQALARDNTYAPAHASLADWHEREGNFGAALDHAQQAFALDTTNLGYRFKVGALLSRTGAPADAAPHLRAVLDAQPWHYQAAYTLGQALQQSGRADEAAAVLERANTLRAQQRDVERLEREARTNPAHIQAQLAYAEALRRSGRLAEALAAYQVALSLRPEHPALQTNIAALYAQLGQRDEALARLQHVLRTDSTYAEAWLNLGLLYAAAGRQDASDDALRRAFRHGTDNPTVQAFRQRMQQRR